MVDASHEVDNGGLERVVFGEVNAEDEQAALVCHILAKGRLRSGARRIYSIWGVCRTFHLDSPFMQIILLQ